MQMPSDAFAELMNPVERRRATGGPSADAS